MLYSSVLALLAAAPLTFLAMSAQAAPALAQSAPDFTAKAVDGDTVKLSDLKGKIVVLEWNNPGCPFVHKHYDSGNMQGLQSWAQGKGVVWLAINSSAPGKEGHMDNALAKDYIAKDKLAVAHYIIDEKGTI